MFGSRYQHAVDILHREQFFRVRQGARRSAVVARVGGYGLFTISFPQIADGGHLDAMAGLQLGHDQLEIPTTISDANMTERNAVVRANDVFVRGCCAWQNS